MKRLLVLGAALAHGAEVVSYFRWRQFPQAQEQFHAGLNRPDFEPDVAYFEAQQVATELETLSLPQTQLAAVALVFDYEADWLYKTQPQGKEFSYRDLTWMFYQALRSLGLDVDFIKPGGTSRATNSQWCPAPPSCTTGRSWPLVRREPRSSWGRAPAPKPNR